MQAPPNIHPSNWVKDCRDNARAARSRVFGRALQGDCPGHPSIDLGLTPASRAAASEAVNLFGLEFDCKSDSSVIPRCRIERRL